MLPTPTPFDPASNPNPIDMSVIDGFSVWEFAPDAIGMWNQAEGVGSGIQIAIFMGLIIAFIFMCINWVRTATETPEADR